MRFFMLAWGSLRAKIARWAELRSRQTVSKKATLEPKAFWSGNSIRYEISFTGYIQWHWRIKSSKPPKCDSKFSLNFVWDHRHFCCNLTSTSHMSEAFYTYQSAMFHPSSLWIANIFYGRSPCEIIPVKIWSTKSCDHSLVWSKKQPINIKSLLFKNSLYTYSPHFSFWKEPRYAKIALVGLY